MIMAYLTFASLVFPSSLHYSVGVIHFKGCSCFWNYYFDGKSLTAPTLKLRQLLLLQNGIGHLAFAFFYREIICWLKIRNILKYVCIFNPCLTRNSYLKNSLMRCLQESMIRHCKAIFKTHLLTPFLFNYSRLVLLRSTLTVFMCG